MSAAGQEQEQPPPLMSLAWQAGKAAGQEQEQPPPLMSLAWQAGKAAEHSSNIRREAFSGDTLWARRAREYIALMSGRHAMTVREVAGLMHADLSATRHALERLQGMGVVVKLAERGTPRTAGRAPDLWKLVEPK
jgi:hypothetical protein